MKKWERGYFNDDIGQPATDMRSPLVDVDENRACRKSRESVMESYIIRIRLVQDRRS